MAENSARLVINGIIVVLSIAVAVIAGRALRVIVAARALPKRPAAAGPPDDVRAAPAAADAALAGSLPPLRSSLRGCGRVPQWLLQLPILCAALVITSALVQCVVGVIAIATGALIARSGDASLASATSSGRRDTSWPYLTIFWLTGVNPTLLALNVLVLRWRAIAAGVTELEEATFRPLLALRYSLLLLSLSWVIALASAAYAVSATIALACAAIILYLTGLSIATVVYGARVSAHLRVHILSMQKLMMRTQSQQDGEAAVLPSMPALSIAPGGQQLRLIESVLHKTDTAPTASHPQDSQLLGEATDAAPRALRTLRRGTSRPPALAPVTQTHPHVPSTASVAGGSGAADAFLHTMSAVSPAVVEDADPSSSRHAARHQAQADAVVGIAGSMSPAPPETVVTYDEVANASMNASPSPDHRTNAGCQVASVRAYAFESRRRQPSHDALSLPEAAATVVTAASGDASADRTGSLVVPATAGVDAGMDLTAVTAIAPFVPSSLTSTPAQTSPPLTLPPRHTDTARLGAYELQGRRVDLHGIHVDKSRDTSQDTKLPMQHALSDEPFVASIPVVLAPSSRPDTGARRALALVPHPSITSHRGIRGTSSMQASTVAASPGARQAAQRVRDYASSGDDVRLGRSDDSRAGRTTSTVLPQTAHRRQELDAAVQRLGQEHIKKQQHSTAALASAQLDRLVWQHALVAGITVSVPILSAAIAAFLIHALLLADSASILAVSIESNLVKLCVMLLCVGVTLTIIPTPARTARARMMTQVRQHLQAQERRIRRAQQSHARRRQRAAAAAAGSNPSPGGAYLAPAHPSDS